MIYVLDTSVVVKWFSTKDEPHLEKADFLIELLGQNQITIVIPNFLLLELCNVLIKAKNWSTQQVDQALEKIFQLNIKLVEANQLLLHESLLVSEKYQLSVYDALYVALAKMEEGVLISDNTKHHGKITDGSVMMLGEWKKN